VALQKIKRRLALTLQWDESLDIGADTGTPMDDQDYQVPCKLTTRLNKLTISIDRPKLTPEDETPHVSQRESRRQAVATGERTACHEKKP